MKRLLVTACSAAGLLGALSSACSSGENDSAGSGGGGDESLSETGGASGDGAGGAESDGGGPGAGGSGQSPMGGDNPGLGGAAGGQANEAPPEFDQDPQLSGNPNAAAPLVGILTFSSLDASTAEVMIDGGGESWSLSLDELATEHEVPILGLKPDTKYDVSVTLQAGPLTLQADSVSWTTPALPEDWPVMNVLKSEPARMEPGMTLMQLKAERDFLIVLDAEGQVRWYFAAADGAGRAYTRPRDGRMLIRKSAHYVIEIDWLGRRLASWHSRRAGEDSASTAVDAEMFHHGIYWMPDGNILVQSAESRLIDDYPTSVTDPDAPTETAFVGGDVIVEFDRSGEIVKSIPILDLLDPTRVGRLSLNPDGFPDSHDWGHGNSITYDSASDAFLISLRHQDAVVKVARETGELVWILGDHANWKAPWQPFLLEPQGEGFKWFYAQHAAEFTLDGVALFDNGTARTSAFGQDTLPLHSRAVRYAIDEDLMTVTQAFDYGPETGQESFYAVIQCDADYLAQTGNMLVTSNDIPSGREGVPAYEYARVFEVTASGEIVFEASFADRAETARAFRSWGSMKIPDIRAKY